MSENGAKKSNNKESMQSKETKQEELKDEEVNNEEDGEEEENQENEEENNPVDDAKEGMNDAKEIAKIGANVAAGNYAKAAVDGIKMAARKLKDKKFRKKLIKMIIMKSIPIILMLVLAAALFSVFNEMKDKMIDLIGAAYSKATGFLSKAWKSITNDNWVDLGEKFEYVVDLNTGETLGTPETIKNKYTDENGKTVDSNGNEYDENGNMLDQNGKVRETLTKEYTLVDQYVRELANKGISIKDLRLLGNGDYGDKTVEELLEDEESKELIEKYIAEFIRADIITQQPHRNKTANLVNPNDQNKVDGGIYFYRNKRDPELKESDVSDDEVDNPKVKVAEKDYKQMEYISPEDFLEELGKTDTTLEELIKGEVITTNSSKIWTDLRYKYTIDPETEKLVILEIKSIVTKEDEQCKYGFLENIAKWWNNIFNSKEEEYEIKVQGFDYKELVSKYSMPYEFLINLCEITQNPEFVYHVALLARNTKICLAIQDNVDKIIEVKDKEEKWETWINSKPEFEGASLSGSETKRIREMKITTTYVPTLRQYSADTWSFYEEYEYTKKVKKTVETGELVTVSFSYPTTLEEMPSVSDLNQFDFSINDSHDSRFDFDYNSGTKQPSVDFPDGIEIKKYYAHVKVEEKSQTKTITSSIKYDEAQICQSIEKSKQFLGLLRNDTGKCEYDCANDVVSKRYNPTALKCAEEAEFNKNGKNVKYKLPNSTVEEAPLNKLESGLQMLYALLQSNSTGYNEKDKMYSSIEEKVDKEEESLSNANYKDAYVIKMQGLVEHLQYLMTFPENEEYDPKTIEDSEVEEIEPDNKDSNDEIIVDELIVKTDEPGALPELSRDELISLINVAFSSSTAKRDNALSLVDVLLSGQNNSKVNPVFILAFVYQETQMGTADSTYVREHNNWSSYNRGHVYKDGAESVNAAINSIAYGNYYFTQGKYTIKSIGYTYCPNTAEYPTQGDGWVKNVNSLVKKYYSYIGRRVDYKDNASSVGEYTSGVNGKTYKIYRQQDYPNTRYWGGSISSKGCGVTTDCMVLSAYDINYTPPGLLDGRTKIGIDDELRRKGLSAERKTIDSSKTAANASEVANALNNKKTVIVHVDERSSYTSNEHWMALVDLRNEGKEAYVLNPNKYGPEGWNTIENIMKGCTEIIIVDK